MCVCDVYMGARYQALMKYEAIGVHVIMRAFIRRKKDCGVLAELS